MLPSRPLFLVRSSLLSALLLSFAIGVCADAAPAELWVAPNGSDANSGTREQPFASLAMAQRRVRELRRQADASISDGATIVLRGGTYELTNPVWLRVEDAGTATSPTVIESANGEHAILSGGRRITGWTRADVLPGLPDIAKGKVWMTNAPIIGGKPVQFRELWVSGRKATRARTPNDPLMSQLLGWERSEEQAIVPTAALGGLIRADGAEMVIEQQWEIAVLRLRTIEISGEGARVTFQQPESALEFQHPWPQPILPPKGGGAFFLVNAIEFLDSPGEWYQDRVTGRVYYWPLPEENLQMAEVVAPVLSRLVDVSGTLDAPVGYVLFRRLGFAYSGWNEPGQRGHVPLQAGMPLVEAYKLSPPGTPDKKALDNQGWIERLPAAVRVVAGRQMVFERCQFEHTGAAALDLGVGAREVRVEGCEFKDIGGNGIQIGFFQEGSVETHVPYQPTDDREVTAQIRVANNVLRDIANADWGCVAILSGYARELVIEHNDISDCSYTGISVGWGWTKTINASRDNRIVGNRITRIATRMCDTAGVYTLSAQRGTIVAENLVNDVTINRYVDRLNHWFYLYTDEGTSGVVVRDNWCPEGKFLQNANGPDNSWENNGPQVSAEIQRRAGLDGPYRDLLRPTEVKPEVDAKRDARRGP